VILQHKIQNFQFNPKDFLKVVLTNKIHFNKLPTLPECMWWWCYQVISI